MASSVEKRLLILNGLEFFMITEQTKNFLCCCKMSNSLTEIVWYRLWLFFSAQITIFRSEAVFFMHLIDDEKLEWTFFEKLLFKVELKLGNHFINFDSSYQLWSARRSAQQRRSIFACFSWPKTRANILRGLIIMQISENISLNLLRKVQSLISKQVSVFQSLAWRFVWIFSEIKSVVCLREHSSRNRD